MKVRFAAMLCILIILATYWFNPSSGGQNSRPHRLTHTVVASKRLFAVPANAPEPETTTITSTTTTTSTLPPPVPPPPPVPTGLAAIPPAWQATAICEEGGKDDPNYGYFGIQEWNGFDGYAKAGDAPLSVQLAWEAYVGQTYPPDAPGQCHSY